MLFIKLARYLHAEQPTNPRHGSKYLTFSSCYLSNLNILIMFENDIFTKKCSQIASKLRIL
jgi:hypothetical protein